MIVERRLRRRPGPLAAASGALGRGAVAPRGRRRRAGPLRQRLRRPRFRAAEPCGVGRLASLAHSTQASFLRQLGWHDKARGWDGRALAVAGGDPEATSRRADRSGRRCARRRAVRRVRGRAAARSRVCSTTGRRGWPSGWHGFRPNWRWRPATARRRSAHAERAVDLAAALGSTRHVVKSDVVLAAALCSDGQLDRSREVADAALADHAAARLRPAELGVGVPARRHRQREPLRCSSR